MTLADVKHLSRLSDSRLLEATAALVHQRDTQTALILAHLAVIARRQAYRPLGYSSLHRYCVHELHLSEHSAYKHVWAVRFARRFPAVLETLAEGRVHLAGVCELARHMTPANAAELLAAATHRTRREIQEMLARRFPKPDVPTLVMAVPEAPGTRAATVSESGDAAMSQDVESEAVSHRDDSHNDVMPVSCKLAPGRVLAADQTNVPAGTVAPRTPAEPRVAPLSAGRYLVQVTLGQHAHDLLRRAQELLAHAKPGCEIADVLEQALAELVQKLEQRKFGDTDCPRPRRMSKDVRHVPAEVRRQVAERDGKRCTFVSEKGTRCPERAMLEYDHVRPVALGGRSTVDNLRLRCRAHNQLEAEQLYGAAFMQQKRDGRRRTCPPTPLPSPAP